MATSRKQSRPVAARPTPAAAAAADVEHRAEAAMDRLGGSHDHPFQVGKNYIFRTLTYHYTGRLERVYEKELVISHAAWIAISGRWAECLTQGTMQEVEPFPDSHLVIIPRDGTHASPWDPPLPRAQL